MNVIIATAVLHKFWIYYGEFDTPGLVGQQKFQQALKELDDWLLWNKQQIDP